MDKLPSAEERELYYDLLKDPCNDRFAKDLPLPPIRAMKDVNLF